MSYLDSYKKFRLNENKEADLNEEDIDEISTSGDAGAYSTPYAFSDTDEPEGDYIEMLGYKKVKKNENQNESAFVKISKELHINEIAYNMYRNDPSYSPKQKVNKSIAEINKKLNEIQKIINQNVKLKEEMGVSNQDFWKSTNDNLSIMGSKMLNIAKKLKELSL